MAGSKLAGPVGLPLDRVDGHLKVTGKAPYAYEYAAQGDALYGVIVPASIGNGRVAAVDVQDAESAPGVRLVLTKDNAPPQHPFGPVDLPDRFARAVPALNNDDVPYFGFPVAFVVADTLEQATAAAAMVRVHFAPNAGFGAHFVEAAVHRDTGEVRVRRMLGVFAAGRILNSKTARSQMLGGMIWGIGSALMEENIVDRRWGSFVNQDLASYHVAVNADVGEMDVVFLTEDDPHGSPLGSKGIGELGICGAGAAVINAIHNATGRRVRDFPATPDKLLSALEALDG